MLNESVDGDSFLLSPSLINPPAGKSRFTWVVVAGFTVAAGTLEGRGKVCEDSLPVTATSSRSGLSELRRMWSSTFSFSVWEKDSLEKRAIPKTADKKNILFLTGNSENFNMAARVSSFV